MWSGEATNTIEVFTARVRRTQTRVEIQADYAYRRMVDVGLAVIELVQSMIRSIPLKKRKESLAFVPEICLTENIPCSADPSYMKQKLLRLGGLCIIRRL